MGKEERNERRKECELKRERKGGKAFRKKDGKPERNKKKFLREEFRESERDLQREGKRL